MSSMNFDFNDEDVFKAFVSHLKSELTEDQIEYLVKELTNSQPESSKKRKRKTFTFAERVKDFCEFKVQLKKQSFSTIFQLESIINSFCSLKNISSKSFGPAHYVHVDAVHNFIMKETKVRETSAVIATMKNYLLYKLGELEEWMIFFVLTNGKPKRSKTIDRNVGDLLKFKSLIDEKLGKEYIISSKPISLSWFRNADLDQIEPLNPMVIPGDCVDFKYLENLLVSTDSSPRFLSTAPIFSQPTNIVEESQQRSLTEEDVSKEIDLLIDQYANDELQNFFIFDHFQ